jgi:hypothetical protein
VVLLIAWIDEQFASLWLAYCKAPLLCAEQFASLWLAYFFARKIYAKNLIVHLDLYGMYNI